MLAGDLTKTANFSITYWWLSNGDAQDMKSGNQIATWITKNSAVLNKRKATEVIKLLVEQFPGLQEVDVRHSRQRYAKWKA